MKFDKDSTTDKRVLEAMAFLPNEISCKVSLREYDPFTRFVFLWVLPSLSEEERKAIEELLQENVHPKIGLSIIRRKDEFLPPYRGKTKRFS